MSFRSGEAVVYDGNVGLVYAGGSLLLVLVPSRGIAVWPASECTAWEGPIPEDGVVRARSYGFLSPAAFIKELHEQRQKQLALARAQLQALAEQGHLYYSDPTCNLPTGEFAPSAVLSYAKTDEATGDVYFEGVKVEKPKCDLPAGEFTAVMSYDVADEWLHQGRTIPVVMSDEAAEHLFGKPDESVAAECTLKVTGDAQWDGMTMSVSDGIEEAKQGLFCETPPNLAADEFIASAAGDEPPPSPSPSPPADKPVKFREFF